MRWPARSGVLRAKQRANLSFFIFIIFFFVFGMIMFTELLRVDLRSIPSKSHYDSQSWDTRTESGVEAESPPPAHAPRDAVWQPVAGTRYKFLVYSAFAEKRMMAAIRIIATTKTRVADRVVCRLWLPNNTTYTLKAKVKAIRENWSMKYSATFVLCLLRGSGLKLDDTVGASVAVVTAALPNQPPTNLLIVRSTDPRPGIEGTLHVCVKPLHYSYSSVDWFMEWFELNRLLGVSHFYLYNHSLSSSMSCLLEDYKRDGLITLLPWTTRPFNNQVDIRTENQFAAFNDCLYRSMPAAGWLLLIDIDELALPRRERTLVALLAAVRASYHSPAKAPSALLFRNAFFYRMWEDDKISPYPLFTSLKTRRRAQPHGLKNRSKYAVRPKDAVELGNHFVWEMMPGAIATGIPTERALLHHYRKACEFGGSSCLTNPSTVDRTAHRWADELNTRVTAMTKRHTFKCAHTDRTLYNQSSYKSKLEQNRP